jgi:hypothetical protein
MRMQTLQKAQWGFWYGRGAGVLIVKIQGELAEQTSECKGLTRAFRSVFP